MNRPEGGSRRYCGADIGPGIDPACGSVAERGVWFMSLLGWRFLGSAVGLRVECGGQDSTGWCGIASAKKIAKKRKPGMNIPGSESTRI